jgi:hypothetical protein
MRDFVPSQEHETGSAEVNGADLRGAPRFALMLRSAKLIADGVEYLCIIRDVSETGVKLRLFHPVPRAASLMIETASGQHYPMAVVWEAKNEAGFRFLERIDVDSFVSESGPYPKRPLRLRVHHPAEVRIGKDSYPGHLAPGRPYHDRYQAGDRTEVLSGGAGTTAVRGDRLLAPGTRVWRGLQPGHGPGGTGPARRAHGSRRRLLPGGGITPTARPQGLAVRPGSHLRSREVCGQQSCLRWGRGLPFAGLDAGAQERNGMKPRTCLIARLIVSRRREDCTA